VYGDSSGAAAYHYLRSATATEGGVARPPVRIPTPIHYDSASRLLLTEALPGTSALPGLVKAELSRAGAGGYPGSESVGVANLVTACGRALAAIHAGARGQVPSRPLGAVVADLRGELDIVGAVWPEQAEHIRGLIDKTLRDTAEPPTSVLCHGDFTPSQVLVADGGVTGIVDFDTVCWGDPASDLGRYLAHLDLLATKVAGLDAEPLTTALAAAFIRGYLDATTGRWPADRTLGRRIALYRSLSLARTALHACRQLKDDRLNLALLLLHTADHRTERVDL
jgi:aminoglycoside phosphotransferase (APT) family kinase protein